MSKFFEEGKFYKFADEHAKTKFTGHGAYATNTAIAKYIGMNPFEVQIDYHNGRERVSRIRVYDEREFIDPSKITGNPADKHGILFNSTGNFAHEFDYFIEVVGPKELELFPVEPMPVKPSFEWKVVVVKNGKIEVHSEHVKKERAERQAEVILSNESYEVCYIIKGDITQATTTKQLKLETI